MPRLDTELVRRGLARSRNQAARLITAGQVRIDGDSARRAHKPAEHIDDSTLVELTADADDFASRGAHKLLGALTAFHIDATGRRVVDAGASTGGFTDVLLRHGAAAVAAVDVGKDQLAPMLAADDRVHVFDRTNIRDPSPDTQNLIMAAIGGPAQLIVTDLSFISLTLVLPALVAMADTNADIVPMVKPQFEVGKGRLGAHGVVRSPALRADALEAVAVTAATLGWTTVAAAASQLPGPSGNVEYFLQLRAGADPSPSRTRMLIDRAVKEGTG